MTFDRHPTILFLFVCIISGVIVTSSCAQTPEDKSGEARAYLEDDEAANTGETGDSGNTGDVGNSGNSGNSGDSADTGNTGNTGDTGNTADTGDAADTGNSADSGNTGNTGDTGNTADTGDTADTGNSADSGNTGNTGDTGNTADTGDSWTVIGELHWSELQEPASIDPAGAPATCQTLGGRLPTISELRTVITGCSATETDGVCGITDSCLDPSCEEGTDCSCELFTDGRYSALGGSESLWSSSIVSSDTTEAWYVSFSEAKISYTDKTSLFHFRCVR